MCRGRVCSCRPCRVRGGLPSSSRRYWARPTTRFPQGRVPGRRSHARRGASEAVVVAARARARMRPPSLGDVAAQAYDERSAAARRRHVTRRRTSSPSASATAREEARRASRGRTNRRSPAGRHLEHAMRASRSMVPPQDQRSRRVRDGTDVVSRRALSATRAGANRLGHGLERCEIDSVRHVTDEP